MIKVSIAHSIRRGKYTNTHTVAVDNGIRTTRTESTLAQLIHISRQLKNNHGLKLTPMAVFKLRRMLKDGLSGRVIVSIGGNEVEFSVKTTFLSPLYNGRK